MKRAMAVPARVSFANAPTGVILVLIWDSFQCLQLEPNAFGPAAQPPGAQVVAFVEGFVIVQLFAIDPR
jgi:hypothetical protein